MALAQLESAPQAARWLAGKVHGTLRTDSRAVQPGDGFIALPGAAHDGRRFVPAALAAGASACLVEAHGAAAFGFGGGVGNGVGNGDGDGDGDDRIAALPALKAAAGAVADAYFNAPSARLDVIASTGTNGKTSTAWWTAQALTQLGRRCGVIGTLGVGEPPRAAPAAGSSGPGQLESTGLTTPDPVALQAALRGFVDQGFAACALEASSIGIAQDRLAATRIAVALFTNFTRDHLDHHGDMAAYWAAKRALFAWPGLRAAVINIDDAQGAVLAAELHGSALDIWTVSVAQPARLQAQGLQYRGGNLAFKLTEGAQHAAVNSQLVGAFNASNLLVVMAALRALNVPLDRAAATVPLLTPVPGRLQRVGGPGTAPPVEVVVDYAHTPDALDKALQALRPLATARGGRLWCVFGCGGNRDATKRPLMGAIAAAGADRVVITSDNPRDEVPATILAHILAGIHAGSSGNDAIAVIEDRRAAIGHAVTAAAAGDVVLLAGKGHEAYQDVAGVKRPFSDIDEARAALQRRAGAGA